MKLSQETCHRCFRFVLTGNEEQRSHDGFLAQSHEQTRTHEKTGMNSNTFPPVEGVFSWVREGYPF